MPHVSRFSKRGTPDHRLLSLRNRRVVNHGADERENGDGSGKAPLLEKHEKWGTRHINTRSFDCTQGRSAPHSAGCPARGVFGAWNSSQSLPCRITAGCPRFAPAFRALTWANNSAPGAPPLGGQESRGCPVQAPLGRELSPEADVWIPESMRCQLQELLYPHWRSWCRRSLGRGRRLATCVDRGNYIVIRIPVRHPWP